MCKLGFKTIAIALTVVFLLIIIAGCVPSLQQNPIFTVDAGLPSSSKETSPDRSPLNSEQNSGENPSGTEVTPVLPEAPGVKEIVDVDAHGDWIYVTTRNVESDEFALYKIKSDGTEKSIINMDPIYDLKIQNDTLYYTSNTNNDDIICKMNLDNGNITSYPVEGELYSVFFTGDDIYYVTDVDDYLTYKIDRQGTKTCLDTSWYESSVVAIYNNNCIIRSPWDENALIIYSLEENIPGKEIEYNASRPFFSDDCLYFTRTETPYGSNDKLLYMSKADLKDLTVIDLIEKPIDFIGEIDILGVDADWVYYWYQDDDDFFNRGIYKIKKDGSGESLVCLEEDVIKDTEEQEKFYDALSHYKYVDGWFYYIVTNSIGDDTSEKLYRINIDGKERQRVL